MKKLIQICASLALVMMGLYIELTEMSRMGWNLLAITVGAFGMGWVLQKLSTEADEGTKITGKVERLIVSDWARVEIWRGYPAQFLQRIWGPINTDETIMYVAIKHPNGRIYVMGPPGRHHNIIRVMHMYGEAGVDQTREQGFLTSRGRFVNRFEALSIAKQRRQIVVKHKPDDMLFSEDMWDGLLPEIPEKA